MEIQHEQVVCNDDPRNIFYLSQACLESRERFNQLDCKRRVDEEWLMTPAFIWCVLNIFIGTAGNLLTLIAIPYAKNHKRYYYTASDPTTY